MEEPLLDPDSDVPSPPALPRPTRSWRPGSDLAAEPRSPSGPTSGARRRCGRSPKIPYRPRRSARHRRRSARNSPRGCCASFGPTGADPAPASPQKMHFGPRLSSRSDVQLDQFLPTTSARHVPPSGAGRTGGVAAASGGGKPEERPSHQLAVDCQRPQCCWSGPMWQGQDSNLCRQCRRFYRSHRRPPAGPLPSPPGSDHRW